MADWTSDTIPKNIMETLVVDDLAVNYEISAGTIQAKNAATAWVNFDGTTTPPTIRDSYNVRDVVRTATGKFEIFFEEDMDNANYSVNSTAQNNLLTSINEDFLPLIGKVGIRQFRRHDSYTLDNSSKVTSIQIFGGKN